MFRCGLLLAFLGLPLGALSAAQRATDNVAPVYKKASTTTAKKHVVAATRQPSYGQVAGLHGARDVLALRSSVALVVDQETQEVLLHKNESAVLPIASITKLMTGLLISEAKLPMDEVIAISQSDVDTEKGSTSRLSVGTQLT
ncbi:MAG: peptidase S11, partial [Rhodoferax sp.]